MNRYGRILSVNLSRGEIDLSPFPEERVREVIGGRGFNAWRLFTRLPVGADPMGPDNLLLFSCGALTGTAAPAASRLHVNALSPLTGILGSSNVGGWVGSRLRSSGVQSVVIRGRAPRPVYLYIDDKTAAIRDAGFLWGLDAFKTQERIKERLGNDKAAVLAIGPGGENGARFACIMTDRDHAAGRTGMGAVMGGKNLKAVAVARGSERPMAAGAPGAGEAVKRYARKIKNAPDFKIFSKYGGAGYLNWADEMGVAGARNYKETGFEHTHRLDGRRLEGRIVRSGGCRRCPVRCKAELAFDTGKLKGRRAARPEFEPMINLGAKCGLGDLETVVHLDNLCSRLGLDSTSAASTIAFAMDLYERGIVTPREVDGLDLSWGNGEAMETLIRGMARMEGFGGVLGLGVKRAAEIIGKGADRRAAHVKGLELTAYHPGAILGTALGYAISSRGGDYNNVYASLEYGWSPDKAAREFGTPRAVDIHSVEGKGRLVRRAVLVNIVLDCLGLCKVPVLSLKGDFDLEDEAELTAALTGRPVAPRDLFLAGERVAAMERLFNLRHGPETAVDGLPPMFFKRGDSVLTPGGMERMLKDFYEAMGWDETGRPADEKMKELGMGEWMVG